jgi:hypothetical protein
MEKTALVGIIFIALVILLASYSYTFLLRKPKIKILSNVTELYSLFTPYMENHVNTHLNAVNCIPTQYYYTNSYVCFICNDFDACFGYGWVLRDEGERMNPKGIVKLENIKKFSVKNADFYLNGLGTKFNCNVKNASALSCDFSISIVFQEGKIVPTILLSDRSMFNKAYEIICRNFNKTAVECSGNTCICGDMRVRLTENGEIFYGWFM